MSAKTRQINLAYIFLLYLFPISGWIGYTYLYGPLQFSWYVASFGFIILFFGSSLLFLLLKSPSQETVTKIVEIASPPIIEEKVIFQPSPEALEEIERLKQALLAKEIELNQFLQENKEYKDKLTEVMEAQANKEEEARRKIESLEMEANQKLQASKHLENQIHDLRYEIKTLLQLTEVDYKSFEKEEAFEPIPSPQLVCSVFKPESAKSLLKRCINTAQKMTTGYHVSTVRSSDPYALDLRRLADAFRQETAALIVVYSPKEERVLFSNAESKTLLGLSSEQFSQDFSEYIGDGFAEWKNGVRQLLTRSEVQLSIDFQTKNHEKVPLNVLLGAIPTGVFRSLVIGVLQAA